MKKTLWEHQDKLKQAVYAAWQSGKRNVMPVLATGGGKTEIMGSVAAEYDGHGIAIAHRQELVSQISKAFASWGVRHNIIAPPDVVRAIRKMHIDKFGQDFVTSHSKWSVGGVDTIKGRAMTEGERKRVGVLITDEGHHIQAANKWGEVIQRFDCSYGMFPSATPGRPDGKGLGRSNDGLVDELVIGPCGRDLMSLGYLTDYDVYCPTASDLNLAGVNVSTTTGDYNYDQLREAVHKSKAIVGDVVTHYIKRAYGKIGVTFAVDIAAATEIAAEFRKRGVPAEVVHGKTPGDLRRNILKRLERREILQVVSVDLIGEGFDLPAIEVISLARPTASNIVFAQQVGRVLRLMVGDELMATWGVMSAIMRLAHIAASVKPRALIFDHVGNFLRHGPPDRPRVWSLDRRGKRGGGATDDAIPLRVCGECAKPYERTHLACPFCGAEPPAPPVRTGPEFVDGDLTLLTQEVINQLWANVAEIDRPMVTGNRFMDSARLDTQRMQRDLRHAIACWAGHHAHRSDRENHKHFWFEFGTTVPQACTLRPSDATQLRDRIAAKLLVDGVTIPDIQYSMPNN